MMCSKNKKQTELKIIRAILITNSYPEYIITYAFIGKTKQLNAKLVYKAEKCSGYFHVPWIGVVSMRDGTIWRSHFGAAIVAVCRFLIRKTLKILRFMV